MNSSLKTRFRILYDLIREDDQSIALAAHAGKDGMVSITWDELLSALGQKVFTCTDHDAHWGIGCASIVIAESEEKARELLRQKLFDHGLNGDEPFTLEEIFPYGAYVLHDGDY